MIYPFLMLKTTYTAVAMVLMTLPAQQAWSKGMYNPEQKKKDQIERLENQATELVKPACQYDLKFQILWESYTPSKMYDPEPQNWSIAQSGEKVIEALGNICQSSAALATKVRQNLKTLAIQFGGTKGDSRITLAGSTLTLSLAYEPLSDGRAEAPHVSSSELEESLRKILRR